jgi:DNA-binding NarL/FixJ family response regulator
MSIRCLIVDDNPRFAREAGYLLQEEGMDLLGHAADGEEAVRLARALRPDLALVDIDLGAESGLAVARRLCEEQDGRLAGAVILISTHGEEEFAELIAASPAVGFLPKSELSAGAIEALLERPRRAPPK